MSDMTLPEKLRSQIGDDVQYIFDQDALFRLAADRIEALEAQLAESQAMVAAAYETACELVAHDYVCDAIRDLTPSDARDALDQFVQKAVAAERERCAQAVEVHGMDLDDDTGRTCKELAVVIRAGLKFLKEEPDQ